MAEHGKKSIFRDCGVRTIKCFGRFAPDACVATRSKCNETMKKRSSISFSLFRMVESIQIAIYTETRHESTYNRLWFMDL